MFCTFFLFGISWDCWDVVKKNWVVEICVGETNWEVLLKKMYKLIYWFDRIFVWIYTLSEHFKIYNKGRTKTDYTATPSWFWAYHVETTSQQQYEMTKQYNYERMPHPWAHQWSYSAERLFGHCEIRFSEIVSKMNL